MSKKAVAITCGVIGCLGLLVLVVVAAGVLGLGWFGFTQVREGTVPLPVAPEPAPGAAAPAPPGLAALQSQAIAQLRASVAQLPLLNDAQRSRATAGFDRLQAKADAGTLSNEQFQQAMTAWGTMFQDGAVTDAELAAFEKLCE